MFTTLHVTSPYKYSLITIIIITLLNSLCCSTVGSLCCIGIEIHRLVVQVPKSGNLFKRFNKLCVVSFLKRLLFWLQFLQTIESPKCD